MQSVKLFRRFIQFVGILLLLTFIISQSALSQEVMPNSSRECAICHIRWIQAFERTKPQEDRMEEVLERQAGSGDMCLSCHDGSVADSRFKVWSTHHHTTDSIPSEAVNIPTETFPLDSQGRMTCATCHTAHAVPDSSDLKTVIFLRKPNVDSSLCLACHPGHAQKNDFQHPLGDVNYPIPQEILDAGGKTSTVGRTIICQTCHEPHGARNAWMLVLPPSKLCITCHADKSPEADPPAGAPMHHIGQVYPGFEPPQALLGEKATFGSNGELSCLSCHRLHDASGAKPLLIRKNEDSSLCLDCHKKEKAVLSSPHDLRISSPETVNASHQTASESGPCGACHRIHGWARDVPETSRPHSSGCMECHQSGGPGSRNRLYVDAHTVGSPVLEDMPIVLPLDQETKSIGCLTCHDPHSPRSVESSAETGGLKTDSIDRRNLKQPRIKVAPNQISSVVQAPRSFLRQEGSQLCVLCHEKLTDLPGWPHDPKNFEPITRDILAVHPSIGSCRVCHITHRAQGPHLWAQKPANPTDRTADLCGACHKDKLGVQNSIHDPETAKWAKELGFISRGSCLDCHPVHDPNEEGDIWSTVSNAADVSQSCETCHRAGAPGPAMQSTHMGKTIGTDTNDLSVNMILDLDGRIQCTTCHDIHQKEQNTKMLIAPIPNLCGRCHEEKLGIPDSIHDPGTAEWARELGFISKGSCIDCHPIHNPPGGGGIWTVIGNEGAHPPDCENCHCEGAPGPAMETPHMDNILGADLQNLPDNMQVSPKKQIQCSTCHDIHQKEQGPKLLASSRQDSGICLVCHAKARGLIDTLHDLRISAPKAHNIQSETAVESGPCGSCHLVHQNTKTGGVWAQGSIFHGKYGSGLCTGCHRDGRCASTRIPKHVDHPDVALVNRTLPGNPGYTPTFDGRGELSPTGAISCLTCHEPHTAPSATETTDGFSLHTRMFLRPDVYRGICVDCHGIETLWRFLYYHKDYRHPYTERNSNSFSPGMK